MISDPDLTRILREARTIAIVGISSNSTRASFGVSRFLQRQGYRIIPVNPAEKEVHGEPAFATLTHVSETIDIVDIFRRSDSVVPVVKEAIPLRPRLIWMQEGVENDEAAQLAQASGIPIVMNRCILKEMARLLPTND